MNKVHHPEIALPAVEEPIKGVKVQMIDLEKTYHVKTPFNSMMVELAPHTETFADHRHPFPEYWLILQGKGQLIYDGKPVEISKGHAFYIESNKTHQVKNTGNEKLIYFAVDWLENTNA